MKGLRDDMKNSVGRALKDAVKGGIADRPGRGSSMWTRTRERIYSFLTFRPFSTRKDISRAIGVSDKTVAWHLDKLMKRGFVTRKGNRYYPTGLISSHDVSVLESFAAQGAKRLYVCILKNPGITIGEASVEADMSRSQVSILSKKFHENGLATRVRNGRLSHLYPTDWTQNKTEEYRKKAPGFIEHVTSLIKEEGTSFEGVRKEDIYTAILKEGSSRYSLVISTNPISAILRDAAPPV